MQRAKAQGKHTGRPALPSLVSGVAGGIGRS
jgi:hypothetical protein